MHRHSYKGAKYSRKKGPRELMLRNLATSIILHEKVKTTTVKAKGIQPIVEKMVSLAKKNDLSSNRAIGRYILDEQARLKLTIELAPLYKDRVGGYTRVIKFGSRPGDNAEMSIIELVDVEKLDKKLDKKEESKPKQINTSDTKPAKAVPKKKKQDVEAKKEVKK
jgi:large subunit ribosomal protein L17